jgi:hypothetical protein
LNVFQPPWGWSTSDEVEILLRPRKPIPHCYLILSFYPTGEETSSLSLELKAGQHQREIKAQLPGLRQGETITEVPIQSAIDLGRVNDAEYRLTFVKTEACSARIDSLRLAASPPPPDDRDAGAVRIRSFKPNRILLEAEMKRPAFVVVSELYYPGWEARVDGQPAPLLVGDYILRAVPVAEGRHGIELRYRPKSFLWGLAITLLTLCAMVMFLVQSPKHRKRLS